VARDTVFCRTALQPGGLTVVAENQKSKSLKPIEKWAFLMQKICQILKIFLLYVLCDVGWYDIIGI
jgi:hypothetical protein